jgi:hypothetical protein
MRARFTKAAKLKEAKDSNGAPFAKKSGAPEEEAADEPRGARDELFFGI